MAFTENEKAWEKVRNLFLEFFRKEEIEITVTKVIKKQDEAARTIKIYQ